MCTNFWDRQTDRQTDGRTDGQTEKFNTISLRFTGDNLRVIDASADGASENFRVLSTGTAYDVIIFKFQGGGQLPQVAPPLRAPMVCSSIR